eukprot:6186264-Pleurochrysis_carterae.AAC.2
MGSVCSCGAHWDAGSREGAQALCLFFHFTKELDVADCYVRWKTLRIPTYLPPTCLPTWLSTHIHAYVPMLLMIAAGFALATRACSPRWRRTSQSTGTSEPARAQRNHHAE